MDCMTIPDPDPDLDLDLDAGGACATHFGTAWRPQSAVYSASSGDSTSLRRTTRTQTRIQRRAHVTDMRRRDRVGIVTALTGTTTRTRSPTLMRDSRNRREERGGRLSHSWHSTS
ncbi:hypothetical protein ID866_4343, partial [Astraeus odoratus]